MNIESELKSKYYYVEFFATMATDHVTSLKEYADELIGEIKQIQTETEMLREKNEKLYAALERIGTQALIVKQTGTIFMDKEETITLHKYISEVLKGCRL